MSKTTIGWTEYSWNPTTGCTKVSAGCQNCYAARMCHRFASNPKQPKYRNGFQIATHPATLLEPYRWRKSRLVFVNSMSDLFHSGVPDQFIKDTFDVMVRTPQHTYQVLTKRSERLKQLSSQLPWTDNIWMGVSVENAANLWRVNDLLATPAKLKFLSIEPMLGPVSSLSLKGIRWVIVGGESGPGGRLMHIDWVREVRDKCIAAKVPFYFKQWGSNKQTPSGDYLDGRQWHQMPKRIHK